MMIGGDRTANNQQRKLGSNPADNSPDSKEHQKERKVGAKYFGKSDRRSKIGDPSSRIVNHHQVSGNVRRLLLARRSSGVLSSALGCGPTLALVTPHIVVVAIHRICVMLPAMGGVLHQLFSP